MKIEYNNVSKLRITEIEKLDPLTIILEDIAPRQGKIIIECFGKSWSASWGGMGDNKIHEFFMSCDNGYLIGNLSQGLSSTVYDYDNVDKWLKKHIIKNRKGKDLTKEEARDLWEDVDLYVENDENWLKSGVGYSLAQKCAGEEFWHELPTIPNYEYDYLARIVDAARAGLTLYFKPNKLKGRLNDGRFS